MSEDNGFFDPPRSVPSNELDLQMQITDPAWQRLSPDLQEKLLNLVGYQMEDDVKKAVYEKLSGILGIYTRDLRLGNISNLNGEFDYVSYYIELSVDLLACGMSKSCIASLNKALARLELSSSRRGFLRKLINTFRQEKITNTLEPEKKNLMGGSKKNGGYN